jgi:predicted nucleotidyltransferase
MLPLIEHSRDELNRLCRRHQVSRLELFGSATNGDFEPSQSDLDFLVEFVPLQPAPKADAYFGLLHDLEDLLQRQIDLVTVEAVKNRRFERNIASQRTLLYAA